LDRNQSNRHYQQQKTNDFFEKVGHKSTKKGTKPEKLSTGSFMKASATKKSNTAIDNIYS